MGKPKCPIDAQSKIWVEQEFEWFAQEFGIRALRSSKTVLPTLEFLPGAYEQTESDIDGLMVRVAGFLDVNPHDLRLSYYEDDKPMFGEPENGEISAEQPCEIWLEVNSLQDPILVVADLSREIAHAKLVRRNLSLANDDDHEESSELLVVFFGAGIFLANTAFFDSNWNSEGWTGWSVGKMSHLSMNVFGYAMAVYALSRDEPNPEWAKFLRPDVLAPFKQGIRYILETGDCAFGHAVSDSQ